VLWATAFSNPGMEDGVLFETQSVHTGSFARVVSHGLLPAARRQHDIRIELMKAIPLTEPKAELAVDKVMDAGPLALREPWGKYRRKVRGENREMLTAEWSRDGSGILGPLPPPGGYVVFEIWAASGQETTQILDIVAPWKVEQQRINIPSTFARHTLRIERAADCVLKETTGVYRLNVPVPYDPALAGIRGYANDLGVLVHRIRIETKQ